MASPAPWLTAVRDRVDARLLRFFEDKQRDARATSPIADELSNAVAALTLRGGKRLRAAALEAGFRAVAGSDDPARTVDAQAAIELLQSYLLIQDDWMDGDLERRGGPSVHAAFTSAHGDPSLGASLAILAADVAAGFAWELIAAAPFPELRLREALGAFGRMHYEVVCGQHLDLLGHPDVSLVHELKTGSYTVRGPLALGALLGDASAAQLSALERFGRPLGLAFQLRDDLLSAFGDARALGKPVGNDLRAGKRTALLEEARSHAGTEGRAVLDAVVGNAAASDADVARAVQVLLDSGARQRVEARLRALVEEARDALAGTALHEAGVALLLDLVQLIAERDR